MCMICPILSMPLVYVVQGHRYDLMEHWGPLIPDVFSWLAIFIRFVIPGSIALVSLVYAGKLFITRDLSDSSYRNEMVSSSP